MADQSYTIAKGDTLSGIGAKFGVNYNDIAKANGIADPNKINAGATLRIPGVNNKAAAPSPAPSNSGGGGSATPRSDFASGLTSQFASADNSYAQAEQDARQKLIDYYGSLEKPMDRYNRINNEQGVPQQQALVDSMTRNVMGTQSQLDQIPGDDAARAGDFLVDQARLNAMTTRDEMPVKNLLATEENQKQYEQVGLQDKIKNVQSLLSLAEKQDEQGAQGLKLGVDYTEKDRATAQAMYKDIINTQLSAFSGDQAAADTKSNAVDKFQYDLALKQTPAAKAGSGKGSGSGEYNANTQKAVDAVTQLAKTSKNPQSDIWNFIHTAVEPNSSNYGIDTTPLWNIYNSAQKVNPGKVTTKAGSSSVQQLQNLLSK